MTVLKKLGEFFGDLIFSFALGFLIVFIALSNFTRYDNLRPLVANLIENQITKSLQPDQIELLYTNLTEQCTTSSNAIVPLGNNTQVSLKCDDVKNSTSSDMPRLIATNLFDQIYYKKYDCNFLDCIRGLPLQVQNIGANRQYEVILSAKANEFFSQNQIYLIVACIFGIILIIVSVRVWFNILKIIGVTLLLMGIIYLFLPLVKSQIINQFAAQDISAVIDNLLQPIATLLRDLLISGIALTIVGYVADFLLQNPEQKKNQPM